VANFHLEPVERVQAAISLGESHFREFKSALEGAPSAKRARARKAILLDVAEALVAFANADGGELLVGVEDDGSITGVSLPQTGYEAILNGYDQYVHPDTPLPTPLRARVAIAGQAILYFAVEKSTRLVHLTSDGRCLQRRDRETLPVPAEQIQFERQEQLSREYDRGFVDGASLSDLDMSVVKRVGDIVAPKMSIEKLLQLLDLADFGPGVVRLRRAALLLFAKDVHRWHPRSEVRILRVKGTEVKAGAAFNVKDQIVAGTIPALLSEAWEALRPHLVETKFAPGGVFEERVMYPEDACREALTNALAHRDYTSEGRPIEVFVFEDRMEVRSPGGLLSNVSLDELRRLRGSHQSRNPFIARVLREIGYMREMGEGLRRIYQLMKAHDLVEPELLADRETFSITLHHRSVFSEDAERWLAAYENANLSRDEARIVLLGREGKVFSAQDIWDTLDLVDTEDYRVRVEALQLKGVLHSKMTTREVSSRASSRNIPRKAVARWSVRPPDAVEQDYANLIAAFRRVGPRQAYRADDLRLVKAAIPASSPYASGRSLSRTAQLLGLLDSHSRPLTRLRALFGNEPTRGLTIPLTADEPSAPTPVLSSAEAGELQPREVPRLFIAPISDSVTESDLKNAFAKFGSVVDVRIPRDVYTGRRRGFGFVEFATAEQAKTAKEEMAGSPLAGRPLRIDWGRAR
jgi:ATP-dependent DNA helicase RecG